MTGDFDPSPNTNTSLDTAGSFLDALASLAFKLLVINFTKSYFLRSSVSIVLQVLQVLPNDFLSTVHARFFCRGLFCESF